MMEKEVKVSENHVWVGVEDRQVILGITNYIQGALGSVIAVELPDIGDKIEEGEIFAEIESVSTVHELIAPISGTVLAVNPLLEDHPIIINEDPYREGWLIEVRIEDDSELDSLMGQDAGFRCMFTLLNVKPLFAVWSHNGLESVIVACMAVSGRVI